MLERLCEAEVPLLLRYAVCETTESVVMAAVQAIHALLVTSTDQVSTTVVCHCQGRSSLHPGHCRCFLMSMASVIPVIGSLL